MRQQIIPRPRRSTLRQRLLRTALVAVAAVLLAASVGKLLGGDGPEGPIARVAFTVTAAGESDARPPVVEAVETERRKIAEVLDRWYQAAFVDPSKFDGGAFGEASEHFAKEAKGSFRRDVATLTIGEARDEVLRVVPETATADVTVFFEKGSHPRFAVAVVDFVAVGTRKEKGEAPLRIVQHGTFHLERIGGRWVVVFYEAEQKQNSVTPRPEGSP